VTLTDALWAAVAADPADDTPKLVLADYLNDPGDDHAPDTADALRWLVGRRKWPHPAVAHGFLWWGRGGDEWDGRRHHLPRPVFDAISAVREPTRRFRTAAEAVAAVGRSLATLRSRRRHDASDLVRTGRFSVYAYRRSTSRVV